ncbi:response regulator receiver domain-containing protein [Alteromonadaceae bacterium 2753L.S.0a.02]|nr:response regulator receiver domain-containing protein [Alteromonadaceae bacterium 2753L.S.0a.02]
MSDEKQKVLVVDDSPSDIQFLIENLKNEFTLTVAKSGEKALQMASQEPRPAAILLDVSMPGMNGYETCKALKQNPETSDIEIIFVSAHDTIEEKMRGYEAGGSDYIIKPVQPDELKQKLWVSLKASQERTNYQSDAKSAMDAAMTAIMDAGELGAVISFLRSSFSVTRLEQLAQLVVECCSSMSLSSSVQIHAPREIVNFCSSGAMPALEAELLSRLRSDVRIHQMGKRLILNYGYVSQIIRNLPDDEEKAGRMRDHLAIILEGANDKCRALILQTEIQKLLTESNESMARIHSTQSALKQRSMDIIDELMDKFQRSFISYGLSEEQETILVSVVKEAVDASLELFEQGLQVDDEMQLILQRIRDTVKLNADANLQH